MLNIISFDVKAVPDDDSLAISDIKVEMENGVVTVLYFLSKTRG